jgi:hypothetical protein
MAAYNEIVERRLQSLASKHLVFNAWSSKLPLAALECLLCGCKEVPLAVPGTVAAIAIHATANAGTTIPAGSFVRNQSVRFILDCGRVANVR